MTETLKSFNVSNDEVKELRFLLYGPVGAGKSSIINTIKTIFENQPFINCLAAEGFGTSFTKTYKKYTVGGGDSGYFPLAFHDMMGLEAGESRGAHSDDIMKALKGHLPNNYKFNADFSISEDGKDYIKSPGLNDKIHCLVSVIPADTLSFMNDKFWENMAEVRKKARDLGVPQVVFMTKVDKACSLTKKDLNKVYNSKKIKDKMKECSRLSQIPMNCIFPVKCYHDETHPSYDINCLMLKALEQIIHSANIYVRSQ